MDNVTTKFDLSSVYAGLDKLANETMYSLARSMGVAAGAAIRDEAKLRVPVKSGKLRDSIYLAFRDKQSNQSVVVYSVTWNSKIAPHGHWIEFGHWRYNRSFKGKYWMHALLPGKRKGKGPQDYGGRGALPERQLVPAHSFLRPAFEAMKPQLATIMISRGKARLQELLSNANSPSGENA